MTEGVNVSRIIIMDDEHGLRERCTSESTEYKILGSVSGASAELDLEDVLSAWCVARLLHCV